MQPRHAKQRTESRDNSLRLRVFARNLPQNPPPTTYPNRNIPNPKKSWRFSIPLSKKSFPFTPSFPSINQNPTNSYPKRNIRIQKTWKN
jgi:hypothetical protein